MLMPTTVQANANSAKYYIIDIERAETALPKSLVLTKLEYRWTVYQKVFLGDNSIW